MGNRSKCCSNRGTYLSGSQEYFIPCSLIAALYLSCLSSFLNQVYLSCLLFLCSALGLRSQYDLKRTAVFANCKRFSVSNHGYSNFERPVSTFIPERNPEFSSQLENVQNGVDNTHGWSEAFSNKLDGVRQTVDSVCKILQSDPWAPSIEIALSKCDENPSRSGHWSIKATRGCQHSIKTTTDGLRANDSFSINKKQNKFQHHSYTNKFNKL